MRENKVSCTIEGFVDCCNQFGKVFEIIHRSWKLCIFCFATVTPLRIFLTDRKQANAFQKGCIKVFTEELLMLDKLDTFQALIGNRMNN